MGSEGRSRVAAVVQSLGWFGFVLVVMLLNALLSFGNDWPGIGVVLRPQLAPEACVLVLGLVVFAHLRGRVPASMCSTWAAVFVLLVLVRYIDVTVPAVLGRPVNLYWDGRHAWQVLLMAWSGQSAARVLWTGCAVLLGIAALFLIVRCCAVWIGGFSSVRGGRLWAVLAGMALPVAFHMWQPWFDREGRPLFADAATPAVHRAVLQWRDAVSPARQALLLSDSPVEAFARADLAALGGGDVLVLFAEAYGAITLDDGDLAAQLEDARAVLDAAIRRDGREVVSARVVSPTFGGGSWLAHSALLSGVDTAPAGAYETLLASDRPTLTGHFARHGYRTVGWMPGLQMPWPEGAYYGYERIADVHTLGYRGPAFGYWRVPDQAAMALLHAQEFDSGREQPGRPRFAVFPTVSSHAPFRPLAPWVDNWAALEHSDAYDAATHAAVLAEPVSWSDPRPAYVASMRYTLTWLAQYLNERASPDLVLVIVGDHQPVGSVTGPGANWEVPVHVISANARLSRTLRERGFIRGMYPAETALGPMHALTAILLEAFSKLDGVEVAVDD